MVSSAAIDERNGIEGVRRRKKHRTTRADPQATCPADLVDRNFTATRPNQLWVTDFTYVATWSGMVYVAFVIDAFSRRIVGWRAATSMTTDLVLDALEMAIWTRNGNVEGVRVTQTPDRNIRRFARPNDCKKQELHRASEQLVTRMTTRWPSRRSAFTRPS